MNEGDSDQDQEGFGPPSGPQSLPGGLPASQRGPLRAAAWLVCAAVAGAGAGLWLAPESPRQLHEVLAATRAELADAQKQVAALQAQLDSGTGGGGHLAAADRSRQEHHGRIYAQNLKRAGAQAAGELMEWFVRHWNDLLDSPRPGDRTGRRAAVLALLVGGMAQNLNPGDYVAWQEEFFGAGWLGELHFDLDGDGMPGSRRALNPHDGFANVSVCQVAMALNLAMTDARIFITQDLRCDRVDARMSVFLQGRTLDDALTEFVRAVRDQGFLAVDREEKTRRLVLVGKRLPARGGP